MKKKHNVKKMMVITLVILFAGTSVAMAGSGGRGMMGPGGGFHLRALMDLDLDDAQKENIAEIIETHQQERQKSKGRIREHREKLRSLMMADEFNEAEFRDVFREMAPVMEERAVARARLAFEVKNVLTPEQLDELKEKRGKYASRANRHRKGRNAILDEWRQKDAE